MSRRLTPASRAELIRRLRRLGFEGPYSGGKHAFMVRGDRTLRIPNPHASDIGVGLLRRLLAQAGLTVDEWLDA